MIELTGIKEKDVARIATAIEDALGTVGRRGMYFGHIFVGNVYHHIGVHNESFRGMRKWCGLVQAKGEKDARIIHYPGTRRETVVAMAEMIVAADGKKIEMEIGS